MKALTTARYEPCHGFKTGVVLRLLLLTFGALFCLVSPICAQDKLGANSLPVSPKLPVYELKIAPKDLAALDADPSSNETRPATFIADGITYEKVRVRYRGDWARSWPKKPIKIFFNDDKPFQGHHSLNLNSAWRDPSFIRETLAYQVYSTCGVPASPSRLVRLNLNGQFRGLYVEVEQVDKAFLKRNHLKGATLYKTHSDQNWADERDLGALAKYSQHYAQETHASDNYEDLQQFCRRLNGATNTLEFFTSHVDLEKYINYLAATALVQNWDCFNKNHFLAHDLKGSKKWVVVPWDLDRTFGDIWFTRSLAAELPILQGTQSAPGPTGWNRMMEKFFADPALRNLFAARLQYLLDHEFTIGKLFPVLDRFEAEIRSEAAMDRQRWRGSSLTLQKGIDQLKNYIERRRNFLLNELKPLRARTEASDKSKP